MATQSEKGHRRRKKAEGQKKRNWKEVKKMTRRLRLESKKKQDQRLAKSERNQ